MPVPPVACEAGGLDAEDRADLLSAHPGDELLEARALDKPGAGALEILVNHRDIEKAHRARLVDELVLTPIALGVIDDLPGGGLADSALRHQRGVVHRVLALFGDPSNAVWYQHRFTEVEVAPGAFMELQEPGLVMPREEAKLRKARLQVPKHDPGADRPVVASRLP